LILAIVALANGTAAGNAGPPQGLTTHGRIVWNLDALLRDKSGDRPVYMNVTGVSSTNFSTMFIDEARSNYYTYTFKTARHSTFRALRPKRPPKVGSYATGENVPFTIRRAYISCGDGKWLYGRKGQDLPGGDMWCSRGAIR
jgi:hypothetical protein